MRRYARLPALVSLLLAAAGADELQVRETDRAGAVVENDTQAVLVVVDALARKGTKNIPRDGQGCVHLTSDSDFAPGAACVDQDARRRRGFGVHRRDWIAPAPRRSEARCNRL